MINIKHELKKKMKTILKILICLSFFVALSNCKNDNNKDHSKIIKQATATSLWWYEKNNEPFPKIGDQYIVTDWDGSAKSVIEITKFKLTPYREITAEFAKAEGDKSLKFWQKSSLSFNYFHRRYFFLVV